MDKAIDLIIPNPNSLQHLDLEILAVCAGYFATGKCLRSANQALATAGCPVSTMRNTGVSYFAIPANTKWNGPLNMEYPDNAGFRLTKLGTL